MSKYNPVIVAVAFNRPESLKRLLHSLKCAKKIDNAKLIISIDNQEPHNLDVKKIAEEFDWPFGEKEVVYQEQRLGLRKHILQCGDYALTYGSVIILEDDLFVSPYFYDYTVQALNYYDDDDENIGGISLYNQPREETVYFPFNPIQDNSDIYFVQFPSSWGQAWTKKQWEKFREWYNKNPNINEINIPDKVITWPETSWKKYFCAYLVKFNRFFAFPRLSLTTNFNDVGTNLKYLVNNDGQTQLKAIDTNYRFINFDNSYCVYDVYFEIIPEYIKKLAPTLIKYSFEMDLYGLKNINNINTPLLITSRPARNSILSFRRALKPHEMNIIFDLQGNDFRLCKKEDILPVTNVKTKRISDYQYYYSRRLPSIRVLLYNYFAKRFPYFFK